MRPPRVQLVRQAVAALLATVVLVVLSGTNAYADPTVAEIEAQITVAWNEAEPLIEAYNQVHEQYDQNKAKQAELEAAIKPLQVQVDLAQARVGVIAARAYEVGPGGGITALLQANSPRELVVQLAYLDQAAAAQTATLGSVFDLKARYDAQKAPIDALVAQLKTQDEELGRQRADIEVRLADLQKLRVQAYGTSGALGRYRPSTCPSDYLPTNGYKAAAFACGEAGKPYVFGAAGPRTYDCSGLTLTAWKAVGVYLPHNAYEQKQSMPAVKRADIQIGDLVFYYSDIHHVAIYVGNGMVMSAPQPGDVVRMVKMDNAPISGIGRPGT